jgi:voltage-gated potassium channel
VPVAAASFCVGRSVRDIERESAGAFLIVAVNRRGGAAETPPPPDAVVGVGDGLTVLGHIGRAQEMAGLFR